MRSHVLLSVLSFSAALFASLLRAEPEVSSVVVNGRRFVNQGLVGVGRLPASLRDQHNETFGSFSALTFDASSWRRLADGTYTGTLYAQPDRGFNNPFTSSWRSRTFQLAVTFKPARYGAQDQVRLSLAGTVLLTEADGTPLTGLDATPAGTGQRPGFPPLPQASNGRISLDAEGIARLPDGSFYVSDEYGPYIYHFTPAGKLLSAIRPPAAFIPQRNGADSFSSDTPAKGQPSPSPANPTTGRQNNQGLEGLSLSPDGKTLFALLQSALRQDGGKRGATDTRRNTRLLAYDISGATAQLTGEYVLQLPTDTSAKGEVRVAAQSEMLAVSNTQFLVIARDSGSGHPTKSPTSAYRWVVVYDISRATNIAGTSFDDPAHPVAPEGVLVPGVTPATPTEFLNLNDATQLTRFGLHNGPRDDQDNLSEKWESLALVPALEPAAPDDYFLFIGNDNDFITQSGFQDGAAYADPSGRENDSMILVFRVTLPPRS